MNVTVYEKHGRAWLAGLFKDYGFTVGAEIGVWRGEHAESLCRTIPGLRLLCVDPWKAYDDYHDPKNQQRRLDDAYRDACARLAPFRCDIKRMSSTEAAGRVPDGSLDFVFVDGNHAKSYVLADLEAWAPKVRSGGIVAGHDYELTPVREHLQVKSAVDEFARRHRLPDLFVLTADKSPSFFWGVA